MCVICGRHRIEDARVQTYAERKGSALARRNGVRYKQRARR
ncbi:hypothetical protein M3J09_003299 [Ascochyta lentis]